MFEGDAQHLEMVVVPDGEEDRDKRQEDADTGGDETGDSLSSQK